jgi:hypothetical protein
MCWRLHGASGSRVTFGHAVWRSGSSERAVPLTRIQTDILGLIAFHRDAESYVAGSSPLNETRSRFSGDIDIFHDRAERVKQAAEKDTIVLIDGGYELEWLRQDPSIYSVVAKRAGETTKLEWVADSDFRFFPTIPDRTFGFMLHPVDLAMNKVQAAASRRELRDVVDVVTVHENVLSLGAVIWAAVEKAPGLTPEGLIAEVRRNSNYPAADWRRLAATEPLDPLIVMPRLKMALDEAEAFVNKMPTDKVGLLFIEDGKVVQPEPDRLDDYQTHAGQRRGHWPSNSEIESAMLEQYSHRRET